MQHQMQSIAQLDDTERSIHGEKVSGDYLKRLKEARTLYREDLIDFVRQCTWYRVTMFARWKLRGMYATCMWLVQLLLMLSKQDPLFSYVPEFYVETLVCAQMLHVTGCFLTMIHLDILLPRDLIMHQAL
jgi:Kip1 ubiquitination-promoting complex protein 1